MSESNAKRYWKARAGQMQYQRNAFRTERDRLAVLVDHLNREINTLRAHIADLEERHDT